MARDYPLTGVGPDNFRWRFSEYSGVAEDNLGIHAHDQYLESLADTGVLGFAAFLWLTLSLVRLAVRRVRRAPREDQIWRAALLASLVAWLTHAAVDDFERFWPTSVAFWLIVGLTVCRPSRPAVRLPIEEPESPGDQRDDDQHNEDAGRTAERRTAAAAAKTDHDF
jgi:O-antigen ligase